MKKTKRESLMKNFALWICCIFIAATGYCSDPIGSVVAVEGQLKALDMKKKARILQIDSDIFVGDTLVTDNSAKGQIRFADGTLILLIPGSQYTVDAYAADKLFTSKLTKGGVRVSTGLIAKKNPENFEVRTANATIGVRGTVFESRLYKGNLYVGSSSGNLSVKNNGGNLAIGMDDSAQFASVSSMRTAPQPLAERPDALNLSNFTLPSGGIAFQGVASQPTGSGSVAGQSISTNGFAWGPGIGALAVMGLVVGVVAGASSSTQSTFSH